MPTHPRSLGSSLIAVALLAACQPETGANPDAPLAPAGTSPAAISTYTALVIPGSPGCFTDRAYDINASGTIVGVQDCPGTMVAFWWNPGNKRATAFPGAFAVAYAVNASGQAVGTLGSQAAFWPNPSKGYSLGDLGGGASIARDINDAGIIVGSSLLAGPYQEHAFRYDARDGVRLGNMVDLGTLPGGTTSQAYAISPSGVIVGQSTTGSVRHAVWWDPSGAIHDLGVLPGGTWATAWDINASNDIVGESNTSQSGGNVWHAFFYSNASGAFSDMGAAIRGGGTNAFGMNDLGAAVGQAQFTAGVHGAMAIPGSTKWLDLGTIAGYSASLAFAIDPTCRSIVGYVYGNGVPDQAVLWSGPRCP